MKQKTVILFIIFTIGLFTIYLLQKDKENISEKAAIGLDAPPFELKDIYQNHWKLSDLRGKVVLLNFWATWCESCKLVNTSIQKLLRSNKDPNIVYITILYKDDPSNVEEYLKKNGLDFPVLIDDKNVALKYGIGGIPETFIINKKGIIREKIVGPLNWDSPIMKMALDQLASE
ncbi:MAG: TlpA family protein disulfide reductase [Thermodesulfovibrionales bacterium]|nr:TlpA family protein disulfide reductase [Thermodesulfovibrionales bacterium]